MNTQKALTWQPTDSGEQAIISKRGRVTRFAEIQATERGVFWKLGDKQFGFPELLISQGWAKDTKAAQVIINEWLKYY